MGNDGSAGGGITGTPGSAETGELATNPTINAATTTAFVTLPTDPIRLNARNPTALGPGSSRDIADAGARIDRFARAVIGARMHAANKTAMVQRCITNRANRPGD
jgi:hypothetical protein